VPAGERQVNDVRPDVPGRAEGQESKCHAWKTGLAGPT
jgi:hypothetical protein